MPYLVLDALLRPRCPMPFFDALLQKGVEDNNACRFSRMSNKS